MQEIAIKYIINILRGTHHSQERGASLTRSALSTRSKKSLNLFLVFAFG